MRTLEAIRQDVAAAVCVIRRSPAFAVTAVLTLALGVGANTAIFTLINAVLLVPLPYPKADRIAQLWLTYPEGGGLILSIPEINLLAQQTEFFQDFAAYDFGGPGVNITGSATPEQVKASTYRVTISVCSERASNSAAVSAQMRIDRTADG